MIEQFYRLHYSQDPEVQQRRLTKAQRSGHSKILLNGSWLPDQNALTEALQVIRNNKQKPSLLLTHQRLRSMDDAQVTELISVFDHFIIEFTPMEGALSGHFNFLYDHKEKLQFILSFDGEFDERITLGYYPRWVREKLYFYPVADKLKPSKIYRIGERIREFFPDIPFRALPELDHFDTRIPKEIPLNVEPETHLQLQVPESDIEISFIIPTYDNMAFLQNSIRHLLMLDMPRKNFEVIVVDDGTPALDISSLASFIAPEQGSFNFQYLYVPKKTSAKSPLGGFRAGMCRNIGVDKSAGRILSFLDSDMLVPANYGDLVKESLQHHDIVQFKRMHLHPHVSTQFVNYTEVQTKNVFVEEATYWGPFFDSTDWMQIPDYWKYTCTYGLSLSREHFLMLGKFRKTYVSYGFEDTDFGYFAAQKGLRFYLNKTPLWHLTHFSDKARYHHSLFHKHRLLRVTAKTFYLNHLHPEIFQKMGTLLD